MSLWTPHFPAWNVNDDYLPDVWIIYCTGTLWNVYYETFFQREKDAKVIVNKYISKYIMVTLEINSLKFSLIRGTN